MAGFGKYIGGMKVGISLDTTKLRKGISTATKLISGFSKTAKIAAGAGTAALGAGLLKLGAEYEGLNREMNRSLSIMGNVSGTMRGEMKQAAIDVARTTNASATDAAKGFFYLASAGLDAQQSLSALPKVSKFAQAGNFDLALATDLLTDAQSALGLTVKDTSKNMQNMDRVSDVLVKANTLANASVEQFSIALTNKAGAALRLVNKDIEEGVAVLATFADQGIKAQEGGTALGIVLRDLQTKAIQNKNQFKQAGVAVFDTAGNMRNMAAIVGDLEGALAGMNDEQKKASLLNLGFSDKSVAFVQALIGTSDKIKQYENALRSAQGTTAEVADKMLTPMEKAMNKLGAAFTQLAEDMKPIVDLAASIAKNFADIIDARNTAKQLASGGNQPITTRPSWMMSNGFVSEVVRGRQFTADNGTTDIGPRSTSARGDRVSLTKEQLDAQSMAAAGQAGQAVWSAITNPASIVRAVQNAHNAGATALWDTAMQGPSALGNAVSGAVAPWLTGVGQIAGGVANNLGNSAGILGSVFSFLNGNFDPTKLKSFAKPKFTPGQAGSGFSVAEAGSAEAHRMRVRIKQNTLQEKLDKQRNEKLDMIYAQLKKTQMAPAGLT